MRHLSLLKAVDGFALGLIAVSLTQILIWLSALFGGLWIGGRFISELQGLQLPWDMVSSPPCTSAIVCADCEGIMIISGAVTEQQQGQQVAGIINLLFVVPMFFLAHLRESGEPAACWADALSHHSASDGAAVV